MADYRKDVLRPLHARKLIEFDAETGLVHLSPSGIRYVEDRLPLTLNGKV